MAVGADRYDALASIQQGRVFMGLLWHDSTPFAEDPAQSKVAGKLGFSLIPSAIEVPCIGKRIDMHVSSSR